MEHLCAVPVRRPVHYVRVDDPVGEPPRSTRLTKGQWAELVVALVLIWTQVALLLVVHNEIAAAVMGLVLLGVVAHGYTWMIPLVRRSLKQRRS